MKKFTFLLSVLIAMIINTNAQIPNNGFEDWTAVGNCMKPDGWFTANDFADTTGTYFGIKQSTDHFPESIGSYSIRIQNNPSLMPDLSGVGFAVPGKDMSATDNPSFPIQGHPESFNGYYKFLPENGDTMRIFIALYNNGEEVFSEKLEDTVTVADWQPFTIDFPEYTTADSARIFLMAMDGDHGPMEPSGNSVLYIDNISFDSLLTISISELNSVNPVQLFYPNPASDMITLKTNDTSNGGVTINIYNLAGKLVCSEYLKQHQKQMNIKHLSNGVYILECKCKEKAERQKLLIQR